MKSPAPGKNISAAEVESISRNGIWLLIKGREYFLPYKDYPWFKNARPAEIHNVELIRGEHLSWPDLDVDLELESLRQPEKYPLTYR
ncbi:MAG: DUF2442 domain-containing protein [Elusimicrobia bacterium]|nr:DUF2442 domain-containing protein [Elusimicrobiota bacterium]